MQLRPPSHCFNDMLLPAGQKKRLFQAWQKGNHIGNHQKKNIKKKTKKKRRSLRLKNTFESPRGPSLRSSTSLAEPFASVADSSEAVVAWVSCNSWVSVSSQKKSKKRCAEKKKKKKHPFGPKKEKCKNRN